MAEQHRPQLPRSSVWVGVDGSPAAMAAVRWAADEAMSRNLPVTLGYASGSVGLTDGHAHAVLANAHKETLRHCPEVETATEVLAEAPIPALTEASRRAALLVVGVSGAGSLNELLLGSTTLAVSGQAHCPVVGVRHWPLTDPTGRAVVVGVRSVEADAQALEVAFERAHRLRFGLVVVHARPSAAADAHDETLQIRAALDGWHRRFPDVALRAEARRGSPVSALLLRLDRVESIVTGCRRRGPATRALLGSTSRAVLRSSSVPVIVTNPDPCR